MPIVKRSNTAAAAAPKATPGASAAQPAGSKSEMPNWPTVGIEAIKFYLFAADQDPEVRAKAQDYVTAQRDERIEFLKAATPDAVRVLSAGFMAGVPAKKVEERARELVAFAVAELGRPLTEPQMPELCLCKPDSLKSAFLRLTSLNIPVCSAAQTGRFTARTSHGTILAQPQPEIGGYMDSVQCAATRMASQDGSARVTVAPSHHAVRANDFLDVSATETGDKLVFRRSFEVKKDAEGRVVPNDYTGAFCVLRVSGHDPLVVYLPVEVIKTRTSAGELGKNTFYLKAPDRELTNVVLREACRRWLLERANSLMNGLGADVVAMLEDDQTVANANAQSGPAVVIKDADDTAAANPAGGPAQPARDPLAPLFASLAAPAQPSATHAAPTSTSPVPGHEVDEAEDAALSAA